MLHRQMFIDAISDALKNTGYVQKDDAFYVYRKEAGLVFRFSFDMIMGGSEFFVYGGAAALSEDIGPTPDGQLRVSCCEMSEYAARRGMPAFSNINYKPGTWTRARYTKAALAHDLARNVDVLTGCLLPELFALSSVRDYYDFRVRADGFGYYAGIPFPGPDAFYLCVQLGMLREAGHVYLMMLRRNDERVRDIDRDMGLPRKYMIREALENSGARSESAVKPYELLEAHAGIVSGFLNDRIERLGAVLESRIAAGRAACDGFFAG